LTLDKKLYYGSPILGRSIVLNDLKKKRRKEKRREEKGRGKLTICKREEKLAFWPIFLHTVVPLPARAVPPLCQFVLFWVLDTGTAVPQQAWAVPTFWSTCSNFFPLFRIIFGQIPIKQIKTNKQNKNN